jgi:putative DeoR family transcriptional regulator (stage III sporulation protein D)
MEVVAMKEYIELRVLRLAEYIVETGDTVRGTSKIFGVSKSTIHKDVSQRLFEINPALAKEVRRVLQKNKAERFVLDVLAAPGFEQGCVDMISGVMKNLRIVDVSTLDNWDKINSGLFGLNMKWTIGNKPVITEVDRTSFFNAPYRLEVLSQRKPTDIEIKDTCIAWIGAKDIQSNSFVFIKDYLGFAERVVNQW